MGTYSLTGFAIISVLCLISSTIIMNATTVLIQCGQPLAVAELAGVFAKHLIPGIPFSFVYELIRKVSQSRNEATPMLISSVVCNAVTISLGYYLVYYTAWGWLGAAVARSAGQIVQVPVILMAMIMGWGEEDDKVIETNENEESSELIVKANIKNIDNDDDIEFFKQLTGGFVINDALNSAAIFEFLSLGLPGMLQLIFEW